MMRFNSIVLLVVLLLPSAVIAQGEIIGWGTKVLVSDEALQDLTAVSAGDLHSLGLKADGLIVAWGGNGSGQCDAPELSLGCVAISAGSFHSPAAMTDRSIVGWGYNLAGICLYLEPRGEASELDESKVDPEHQLTGLVFSYQYREAI